MNGGCPLPSYLKNVLESLPPRPWTGKLAACVQISVLDPWAVCPWANSIPSLSLRFLVAKVAMGCEDFLG